MQVKWALGYIMMNKASWGDGIPVELFQILKDEAVKVLHSICQKIWKTQQWPKDWKRSVFIPIPKKGNTKECSNYHTVALISHASKVMLKILQDFWGFNSTWTENFQMFKLVLEKAEESEIELPTSIRSTSKRIAEKYLFLFYWLCQSLWLCRSQQTMEILKEMGIPDHLTCLLRNLYAGQEATVRTGHEIAVWFQIGKGVCQGCILSPCLFNFYAEHIMWNAGLDEAQARIKFAKRNINNLRYADNIILMAESEEELRASWIWRRRVKKLAESSSFRKLRPWHPVPSLHGK